MREDIDLARKDLDLEIYRQKYEIFRHFDNLRWHIPTFCLGAGSILLAFASKKDQPPDWWAFVIFGILSLFSSFAVKRVRKGIHDNYIVLDKIAKIIGDEDIPPQRDSCGATWWLIIILVIVGLASIVAGFSNCFIQCIK